MGMQKSFYGTGLEGGGKNKKKISILWELKGLHEFPHR